MNDSARQTSPEYTFAINVRNISNTPTSQDVQKVLFPADGDYTFSMSDFPFTASGQGGTLSKIKIVTLPNNGSLKLNGAAVTVGQEIDVSALNTLVFDTPAGNSSTSRFTFHVIDSGGNASEDTDRATAGDQGYDFNIVVDGERPASRDVVKNELTVTKVLSFAQTDFFFRDPDGDTFASVKITRLPTLGKLVLRSEGSADSNITVNQVIPVADLAKLTYLPPAQAGTGFIDKFFFKVVDSGSNESYFAYEGLLKYGDQAFSQNVNVTNPEPGTGTGGRGAAPLAKPQDTNLEIEAVPIVSGKGATYTPRLEEMMEGSVNHLTKNGLLSIRMKNTLTKQEGGKTVLDNTEIPNGYWEVNKGGKWVRFTDANNHTGFSLDPRDLGNLRYVAKIDNNRYEYQQNGSKAQAKTVWSIYASGTDNSNKSYSFTYDLTTELDNFIGAANISADVQRNQNFLITKQMFRNAFTDDEDGSSEALAFVRIVSLPTNGKLYLDGKLLALGSQGYVDIAIPTARNEDIKLSYTANPGTAKYDTFKFRLIDNDTPADISPNYALFAFTISGTAQAPTSENKTFSVNENTIGLSWVPDARDGSQSNTSIKSAFTNDFGHVFATYNGTGNREPEAVIIVSLPSKGQLVLDFGTNNYQLVRQGQRIEVSNFDRLKFRPLDDEFGNNYASFTFRLIDSDGQSERFSPTYSATINVIEQRGNVTPPASVFTGEVDTILVSASKATPFTATEIANLFFKDNATDTGRPVIAGNIATTKFAIQQLPTIGNLYLNGVLVRNNQSIDYSDLTKLSFDPAGTLNGLSYMVYSTTTGSYKAPARTLRFNPNDKPVSEDFQIFTGKDGVYSFTQAEFKFSDPDGDRLDSVQILQLPDASRGKLVLKVGNTETNVSVGQKLTASQLNQLVFKQVSGYVGETSFKFAVWDNNKIAQARSTTYEVKVNVGQEGPFTRDASKTGTEDKAIYLTIEDFDYVAKEGSSESVTGVLITGLPRTSDGRTVPGVLQIDKGGALGAQWENIHLEDGPFVVPLSSTKTNLRFLPHEDWYGDLSFKFRVLDTADNQTTNEGVMRLKVTPVPDNPRGYDIVELLDSNQAGGIHDLNIDTGRLVDPDNLGNAARDAASLKIKIGNLANIAAGSVNESVQLRIGNTELSRHLAAQGRDYLTLAEFGQLKLYQGKVSQGKVTLNYTIEDANSGKTDPAYQLVYTLTDLPALKIPASYHVLTANQELALNQALFARFYSDSQPMAAVRFDLSGQEAPVNGKVILKQGSQEIEVSDGTLIPVNALGSLFYKPKATSEMVNNYADTLHFTLLDVLGAESAVHGNIHLSLAGRPLARDTQVSGAEDSWHLVSQGDLNLAFKAGATGKQITIGDLGAGSYQYKDGNSWKTLAKGQVISLDSLARTADFIRFKPAANRFSDTSSLLSYQWKQYSDLLLETRGSQRPIKIKLVSQTNSSLTAKRNDTSDGTIEITITVPSAQNNAKTIATLFSATGAADANVKSILTAKNLASSGDGSTRGAPSSFQSFDKHAQPEVLTNPGQLKFTIADKDATDSAERTLTFKTSLNAKDDAPVLSKAKSEGFEAEASTPASLFSGGRIDKMLGTLKLRDPDGDLTGAVVEISALQRVMGLGQLRYLSDSGTQITLADNQTLTIGGLTLTEKNTATNQQTLDYALAIEAGSGTQNTLNVARQGGLVTITVTLKGGSSSLLSSELRTLLANDSRVTTGLDLSTVSSDLAVGLMAATKLTMLKTVHLSLGEFARLTFTPNGLYQIEDSENPVALSVRVRDKDGNQSEAAELTLNLLSKPNSLLTSDATLTIPEPSTRGELIIGNDRGFMILKFDADSASNVGLQLRAGSATSIVQGTPNQANVYPYTINLGGGRATLNDIKAYYEANKTSLTQLDAVTIFGDGTQVAVPFNATEIQNGLTIGYGRTRTLAADQTPNPISTLPNERQFYLGNEQGGLLITMKDNNNVYSLILRDKASEGINISEVHRGGNRYDMRLFLPEYATLNDVAATANRGIGLESIILIGDGNQTIQTTGSNTRYALGSVVGLEGDAVTYNIALDTSGFGRDYIFKLADFEPLFASETADFAGIKILANNGNILSLLARLGDFTA